MSGDGTPIVLKAMEDSQKISGFETKEEADEAARMAGWQTEDAEGSNHRCPDCLKAPQTFRPSLIDELLEKFRRSPYAGMEPVFESGRGAFINRKALFGK